MCVCVSIDAANHSLTQSRATNTPHSIPLHTTRLPESMSPRPDTLSSSASFVLHFDDGTDPEQEEQQQQLAHEEGYEESEGICGGGAEGHPAPESPNRYFSVRYPAGVDVAALLAAAGDSGSGSLLVGGMWVCDYVMGEGALTASANSYLAHHTYSSQATGSSSSSPTILEAPEGEGQEENGEAAATTAREPASTTTMTGTTATTASASASVSATEQDLDPLVAEDIRPFNLPAGERVIESYSCALLPTSLLIHGRLYVTPRFVCFGSWGATRLVLPMEDISFIEKANTMVRLRLCWVLFYHMVSLSCVWTGWTCEMADRSP